MAGVFKQLNRNELISFSKPTQTVYRDQYGALKTAPANTLVMDHTRYGLQLGYVFGGGATMSLPVNSGAWNANADSSLVVFAGAPEGEVILRWGETEIIGTGGSKLYIVNVDASTSATNGNTIQIFPNAPSDTTKPRHIGIIKYYSEFFAIPELEEEMVELNNFVNGDFLK